MPENVDTRATHEDPSDLLTTTEVTVVARISRSTLTRAVKNGKITPLLTPGGHFRFRRSDVDALLTNPAATA